MYVILTNYFRNQLIKPTAPDSLLCHNSNIPLKAQCKKGNDTNYSFTVAAQLKGTGDDDEVCKMRFRDCLYTPITHATF